MKKIVPYLFIFLFIYTAYDKITDHNGFEQVLSKSPLLSSYPELISLAAFALYPHTKGTTKSSA